MTLSLPSWLISDNSVTAALSGVAWAIWRGNNEDGIKVAIVVMGVGLASSYFHLTQMFRGNVVNGAKN